MSAQGLTLQPPATGVMLNGVLSARPLSAILQEEAAAAASRATQSASEPVVSSLVSMVKKHWELARRAKEPIEREMLSAVRSRRGEYDPDKLSEIRKGGGSEIYMMIFATKARQFKALLTDVLVGSGAEKPWTFKPTPLPELPPSEVNQIMQAVYQEALQAEMSGMPASVEDIRQRLQDAKASLEARIMESARREAERAEMAVEDLLLEGGYLEALDQFIDDLAVFKTAFIKGPVMHKANELAWVPGENGTWRAEVQSKTKAHWYRVDPLMMYPSPWATSVHDSFLFERHRLARGSLSALIGVEGYSDDAIRAVLQEHGVGGLHNWLAVDTERAEAEGRHTDAAGVFSSDQIDALQYWGSVSGKMLREWGMAAEEVEDDEREYEVELWVVGNWVIKAALNPDPLKRRTYYGDGFSRIPGAFWHNSLFDVVRDCQDMANAAARSLANNMGIASGPQVYVMVDRLAAGEEITELYPWKIHQVIADPSGSTAAPIGFFQPSSHATELMAVFEKFSQMADDYAGLPKYMSGLSGGEGGAGRTASGMSMMINNASKQIKQTVSSIDLHVISPMVRGAYHHVMQFAEGSSLAGDLQVQARGALSLIAKESAMVRMNEFLAATGNPIDMQIIGLDGRAEVLRHAAKRLDLNVEKVVPSATVVKQRAAVAQQQALMQQMAAQGGQPGQPQGNGQQLMDGAPTTDNFQPA